MKLLKEKSGLTNIIRQFFLKREYIEVDTPILSPALIPESCIEVFKTEYISQDNKKRDYFLIPSPEVWMKKLLSNGSGNIFQIVKSFRNTESEGRLHNPEFTMLEWYTVNKNYMDSIKIMQELIDYIMDNFQLKDSVRKIFENRIKIFSMKELFSSILNINLDELISTEKIIAKAVALGQISRHDDIDTDIDTWESAFNKIFLNFIEPELIWDRPVIIYDYPSKIPCLAKNNGFYSERWELYIKGIEIVNCYSEETDSNKVKDFFINEEKLKLTGLVSHPADKDFLEIFNNSFPECSGAALGMERFLMVILDIDSIDKVVTFPFLKKLLE